MASLRLSVPVFLSLLASGAMANEICQGEFEPLVKAHQATMNRVNAGMPKGKPKTYDQAVSRAQTACQMLAPAVASFQKLDNWLSTNQAFCQIPDKIVTDVRTGLANIKRSQAQACGAVGQLKAGKAKAEAAARQQQQQGGGPAPGAIVGGTQRDDPFSVKVGRKPQLQSL